LLAHEDDADEIARRVAEVTGMVEGAAAPGESFWAVRRFVEALARERPLVLMLDDIHWAEPTLLDLIEYLGEWAEGPVLILCAARRELLESRRAWGGPTSTGFVLELTPLGPDEVGELVLGLSDAPVDPSLAGRIVEQAGGNPLFAEQLLALAIEAPELALDDMPPTVEAMLASRLDRLDPQSLAVLRRASVLGRRFKREELDDLTPAEEADRTGHHLAELSDRAFVHPRQDVFAFHHVLVRDVSYRGIPKTDRADLHELAARGLDRRAGADELVGYHLEQAYRFLSEIGRVDDRAHKLAAEAGERLGVVGIRAWKLADVPAAVNLLSRAVDLKRDESLICELGLALNARGERGRALDQLADLQGPRAPIERAFLRTLAEPNRAGELLEAATAAIPVFEQAGDDRSLGRAWYGVAFVRGSFYCEYAATEEAAERMAACYRRAGWSTSAPVDLFGQALTFGPRPVDEAVARLEPFSEPGDRAADANSLPWLAWLESMRGNFDVARLHVERARVLFQDLGLKAGVVDVCGRTTGAIELLANRPDVAERSLRDACALLQERHETAVLATRAAELAATLCEQGRYDEAAEWVRVASENAGEDDLDAALTRQPVEAKLLARRGEAGAAEQLARATVKLAERTDALNRHAEALLALTEVLASTGSDESPAHLQHALALYERKGNLAAARLAARRMQVAGAAP
jgi:tetratricopeptide (TPR) repeat protein